jgi:hypothetical protein
LWQIFMCIYKIITNLLIFLNLQWYSIESYMEPWTLSCIVSVEQLLLHKILVQGLARSRASSRSGAWRFPLNSNNIILTGSCQYKPLKSNDFTDKNDAKVYSRPSTFGKHFFFTLELRFFLILRDCKYAIVLMHIETTYFKL